jgi:hypothetical protein
MSQDSPRLSAIKGLAKVSGCALASNAAQAGAYEGGGLIWPSEIPQVYLCLDWVHHPLTDRDLDLE